MTDRDADVGANDPIVRFYRSEAPDHAGRTLGEILSSTDGPLEYTHDYIQWLFPMRERSPVNPSAPTVNDRTIASFRSDPALRDALAGAFRRMATFYGFDVQESDGGVRIVKSPHWSERSANWLTPGNHNMLRITRILKCLRLLGLQPLAAAFFNALNEVYASEGARAIGPITYRFWKSAATD